MMKRLFALATTKLVDAACYDAAKTDDYHDDDSATVRTDGGDARVAEGDDASTDGSDATAAEAPSGPESDAEALLYADDDEFEAAFGDEWPGLPGEGLTWLVEEEGSEPLLVAYDRDSDSDDEFLQTRVHRRSDGGSHSADE